MKPTLMFSASCFFLLLLGLSMHSASGEIDHRPAAQQPGQSFDAYNEGASNFLAAYDPDGQFNLRGTLTSISETMSEVLSRIWKLIKAPPKLAVKITSQVWKSVVSTFHLIVEDIRNIMNFQRAFSKLISEFAG